MATIILYICKNWKTLSLAANLIVNPFYYIFVSVMGWILLYSISRLLIYILPYKGVNVLGLFGQSSLFILLLHIQIWSYVVDPITSAIFGKEILLSSTMYGTVYKGFKILIGLIIPSIFFLKYVPIDRKIKRLILKIV